MKKALSTAAAAALALGMIGVGVVSLSLGKIVKSGVEAAGPRLLGAPVTLDLASISPWSGRGTLRGLVIGNPAGFRSPYAARVASVEVEVKLSSLLTDTIVVERAVVREPELIWEIGPDGSNLTRLQRDAEAAAEAYGGGEPVPAAGPAHKGKSLLIQDFSITGGRVGLSAPAFGGRGLSAPLSDVRLTNVGGRGRSPAQAAAEVLGAITSSAQTAAANALDAARGAALSALGAFLRGGK